MPRPQNRLTDRTLRSLKPDPLRPYDLADGADLYVRVESSGSVIFWLRYQLNGKRRRWVLGHYGNAGMSLSEARERRAAAQALLRRGVDPMEQVRAEARIHARAVAAQEVAERAQAREQEQTVAWLLAQFCEIELPVQHKRPEWARGMLRKHLEAPLGAKPLTELTRNDVWVVLDPLRVPHPATARHLYGLLKKLFAFGVARGWLAHNPAAEIERKAVAKKPAPRARVLGEDEMHALWHDFGNGRLTRPVWLALKLLLVTGQRRGEITRATWGEFDLKAARWIIPAERLGKKKPAHTLVPHLVPLAPRAVELLKELQALAGASAWVLPSPLDPEQPIDRAALTRAVARKGVTWTPHDLRRTVRTRLSALGVSAVVAERVIGHELPELLRVYDLHAFEDEKREALSRWAGMLAQIVGADR